MRETLFVLIVIFALMALTAYRYRRRLRFAMEVWRTVRSVREIQARTEPSPIDRPVDKGRLVNCSKCGTWAPESTAIKLGPTIYYCSTKCLPDKARV